MQFIVTLDTVDYSGKIVAPKFSSFGPFDSQAEAGEAAKRNFRAGDRRKWMVIPLSPAAELTAAPACRI